jgi:sugar phosphate isomerase/epimerase
MKLEQVAIQLYTLRDHAKTAADLAKTLKRVADIGYQAVQISGIGPIPEDEVTKMLQDNNLVCCATHENGDKILNEPAEVVEKLRKLGCKYTAYPYPAGIDFNSKDSVKELIEKLNAAGKLLHENGQVLAYHNHAMEFYKIDGKTILDWIYDSTDPKYVLGEPDTYWVQAGGADPVEWCRKLKNRLPLIHLKDYAIDEKHQPRFAEIGSGNLNFPAIIAAAEEAGCEWFIVEQDSCPGDPFESIKMSFDYIKAHLVK